MEKYSKRIETNIVGGHEFRLRIERLVKEQVRAALELLRDDFESAALPLEVFLRGLDVEPALQRSA